MLGSKKGAKYGVTQEDEKKATVVGDVIKAYINGVEVLSVTDGTFSSGNPGMGFNYGVGSTYADFGFTTWSASDSTMQRPAPPQNLRISAIGFGALLLAADTVVTDGPEEKASGDSNRGPRSLVLAS